MGSVVGIVQAVGQMTSGYASAYQMQQDARIAGYQADYEVEAAAVEEADFREQANEVLGRAQAATGVSGFDASYGSASDAVDTILRRRELDAAVIRHGGQVGRWVAKTEQASLQYGAKAAELGAHFAGASAAGQAGSSAGRWWASRRSAQSAGGGGGGGASGGGGYGSQWYDYY